MGVECGAKWSGDEPRNAGRPDRNLRHGAADYVHAYECFTGRCVYARTGDRPADEILPHRDRAAVNHGQGQSFRERVPCVADHDIAGSGADADSVQRNGNDGRGDAQEDSRSVLQDAAPGERSAAERWQFAGVACDVPVSRLFHGDRQRCGPGGDGCTEECRGRFLRYGHSARLGAA